MTLNQVIENLEDLANAPREKCQPGKRKLAPTRSKAMAMATATAWDGKPLPEDRR